MQSKSIFVCNILLLWFYVIGLLINPTHSRHSPKEDFQEKSPYNQNLNDCTKTQYPTIQRKTNVKAILCPMFKDEEGFLSEWVAYYQMHGFDHIMMFDDESSDNSLVELKPWIDSGFVSIRSNWSNQNFDLANAFSNNEFKKMMAIKSLLETECKLYGIQHGYNITISLDIDEYVIPRKGGETVVDELYSWMNSTGRSVYCMDKLNFQSTPHILEPVNLLTIEAYHSRMRHPRRMSYYTTVAPKCAYQLHADFFTNYSSEFIARCCHFHGCEGTNFVKSHKFCSTHYGSEAWRVNGKGKPWYDALDINHYSRSLEKYAIKSKTWKTATGEVKQGDSSSNAAKAYDIPKFLARNLGWFYDPVALRYTCQLRQQLQKWTNESIYFRPGDQWYRNAEFGRSVGDPDKRGRYGRQNPEGYTFHDGNQFHYHGIKYSGQK